MTELIMKREKVEPSGKAPVKPVNGSGRYQPTKHDMLRDVSVSVTPERLVKAVLKGGAPRRDFRKN